MDDRRGVLVPFANPDAIVQKTLELLDTPAIRHAMRKRAYLYAREMVWKKAAQGYMGSFERARAERSRNPRVEFSAQAEAKTLSTLPALKLDHLKRLTDDTGILQHAIFSVPNYSEGYTTDDNARALLLAMVLEQLGDHVPAKTAGLAPRYLAFLEYAFNPEARRFRNFLHYDRRWAEQIGSEDSHGRALWALGAVLGRSRSAGLRGATGRLFEFALPPTVTFTSPRAWAFTMLGIQEYLTSFPGDRDAQKLRSVLGNRLLAMYESVKKPSWKWFEDVVAYSNARLPQALLLAGASCSDERMISAGLESLDWLLSVQRCAGESHFVPIGSQGFYRRDGEKARFDQQPVEAAGTISACLEAYRITGDAPWLSHVRSVFNWFLGDNDLQRPLYDSATGGCRDGLHPDRVNENQGAESTLSFLTALAEIRFLEKPEVSEPNLKIHAVQSSASPSEISAVASK